MTNYYVRETPDGADVLNRISVTISALVCTCYEVSTAQQIVNALNAQAPPAAVPAEWPLHDRVEFALRDAGFDYDEASRIAMLAAAAAAPAAATQNPKEK